MAQSRNFGFGPEEIMLRDGARRLLQQRAGVEALRKTVAHDHVEAYESDTQPARYDEALWQTMVELGWTSVAVPEDAGGMGMSTVAAVALAEEIGRAALPSPFTATLLATYVLRSCSGPGARPALERIAAGAPTTLVATNQTGVFDPRHPSVSASQTSAGINLNGTAYFVQDARKCSTFLVAAEGVEGIGLYVVDADAPGLEILPDQIADLTRDQARVRFESVVVEADGIAAHSDAGVEAGRAATPALQTIVAADMCGAAEWQLQTTVEYARIRKQFDRPLGFFQAVKHPLVNMMLDIDRARSLVYNAACAVDEEPERAEYFARMAKAAACDTAELCSNKSVQLHGGIGFTWECDVHLWFKRQMHSRLLYGDATYQRARLAELVVAEADA
jgi:alkylation response protein AidB-like acyl-CoA dehydrogenase